MSIFDLEKSLAAAEARLPAPRRRRRRADAGRSRLPAPVVRELTRLARGDDRPPIELLQIKLRTFCHPRGLRAPSRASVYNFLARCPTHTYVISELPEPVRDALYNLGPTGTVPGHQLVFYAFQYGDLRAASFAAGLPWLALYQADRMRGWRDRSRGLLRAAMRRRGIA